MRRLSVLLVVAFLSCGNFLAAEADSNVDLAFEDLTLPEESNGDICFAVFREAAEQNNYCISCGAPGHVVGKACAPIVAGDAGAGDDQANCSSDDLSGCRCILEDASACRISVYFDASVGNRIAVTAFHRTLCDGRNGCVDDRTSRAEGDGYGFFEDLPFLVRIGLSRLWFDDIDKTLSGSDVFSIEMSY